MVIITLTDRQPDGGGGKEILLIDYFCDWIDTFQCFLAVTRRGNRKFVSIQFLTLSLDRKEEPSLQNGKK